MKKNYFIIFMMFALSSNHICSASQESDVTHSRRERTRAVAAHPEHHLTAAESFINRARQIGSTSSLHLAAFHGGTDVVILLLEAGARVNAQDSKGRTPLHMAAFKGNTKIVALLLKHGADVDKIDIYNRTPLFLTNEPSVANLLIQAGTDLECTKYRYNRRAQIR